MHEIDTKQKRCGNEDFWAIWLRLRWDMWNLESGSLISLLKFKKTFLTVQREVCKKLDFQVSYSLTTTTSLPDGAGYGRSFFRQPILLPQPSSFLVQKIPFCIATTNSWFLARFHQLYSFSKWRAAYLRAYSVPFTPYAKALRGAWNVPKFKCQRASFKEKRF